MKKKQFSIYTARTLAGMHNGRTTHKVQGQFGCVSFELITIIFWAKFYFEI